MKVAGGMVVFSAAVFLGLSGVRIGSVVELYRNMSGIEVAEPDPDGIAPKRRGIDVTYAGIRSEAQAIGTVYLIFFIHNRTDQPLAYIGYSADHSFPLLKANDEMLPSAYVCSRGSQEFKIAPGCSAKLLVAREEFLTRPSKYTSVSVGFRLRPAAASESAVYYSEPFALPDGFLIPVNAH
jgi:hypothetical protein